MEWVTGIMGLIGGGWGTFASLIIGLIAFFVFRRMWIKAKEEKAHVDTKDKEVSDHKKAIEKNQKHQKQAAADEKASEEALEEHLKDS